MSTKTSYMVLVSVFATLALLRLLYFWIDLYDRGIWNIVYAIGVPVLLFATIYEDVRRKRLVYIVIMVFALLGDNLHHDDALLRQIIMEMPMASALESASMWEFIMSAEFLRAAMESSVIVVWWVIMIWVGCKLMGYYRECDSTA